MSVGTTVYLEFALGIRYLIDNALFGDSHEFPNSLPYRFHRGFNC
jgi:hypothetical protein